ncbi:MAG: CpaF family protein, partial [Bacillota bacterium]
FEANPNLYPIRLEAHRMLIERVVIDENEPREHLERRLKEELSNVFAELRKKGRKINLDEQRLLEKKLLDDVLGLGEIEELVRDQTVTEIMVNGPNQIYVERNGLLELTDHKFTSNDEVKRIIERIVSPLGRRIDESSPAVDARLPDGSRVHAIIPPLAINGPTLTIRKFSKSMLTANDLLKNRSITHEMLTYLKEAVVGKRNIIVSGGTGSGKTTLLNIISGFIPEKERIVCIEDSAELNLNQSHVVRLEARPANVEGKGQVTIRDLVRHALRMRPDRIVVGEVRGAEALDMLQAMNTGHSGSLTTAHANTPEDMILRLETMVLMSGYDLPIKAIREQIAAAIDVIIQTQRLTDGSRKVTSITEIKGIKKDAIIFQKVF